MEKQKGRKEISRRCVERIEREGRKDKGHKERNKGEKCGEDE